MLLIVIKTSTDSANPDLLHTVNQHCIVGKIWETENSIPASLFPEFFGRKAKVQRFVGKTAKRKKCKKLGKPGNFEKVGNPGKSQSGWNDDQKMLECRPKDALV